MGEGPQRDITERVWNLGILVPPPRLIQFRNFNSRPVPPQRRHWLLSLHPPLSQSPVSLRVLMVQVASFAGGKDDLDASNLDDATPRIQAPSGFSLSMRTGMLAHCGALPGVWFWVGLWTPSAWGGASMQIKFCWGRCECRCVRVEAKCALNSSYFGLD
jgi:hypothetical protein